MTKASLKENLLQFCEDYVHQRISRINSQIDELNNSLISETKSSAGDKHETGRAMLQLEREKLGQQLFEAEKMQPILNRIETGIASKSNKVVLGCVVETSKGDYFIGISAGEYRAGKDSIYCISLGTPIGLLLLGKMVGEKFIFNGKNIEVLRIL